MSFPRQWRTSAPEQRWRNRVRQKTSRLLALTLITFLTACSDRRDPNAAFVHVLQTLNSGQTAEAAREAEKDYAKFHRSSEWAWKFAILRARAVYRQGMYDEVITILEAEPGEPPTLELKVRKKWIEGYAYASLYKFSVAEREFQEAGDLCGSSVSTPCTDVVAARGEMEMQEGHYAAAYPLFERELAAAKASDRSREPKALLNLSWSAEEQTHFDEALDLASAARKISVSRGLASVAEKALGNMAWADYKLGDLEKAREMFAEARIQAERLGDIADQIKWITNAAYIDMDWGDVQQAETSFAQSLDLARKINSREDIINSLIALAFVSEQTGRLDDAKRYSDEALAMAQADKNGRDVVYPLLVEGRIAARKHDTDAAEADFREVTKSADTPVFLKWEAERSLARLYEDENKSAAADGEYRTALTTFEAARCDLHERVDSRLPFLSNAARIYEDYMHFLVTRGRADEALRVADYARARTLAEGLGRPCKTVFAPEPLNAPEIARHAGGTILFYALGQEHSYLWVIKPDRVRVFRLSANQSEIDSAVERYRKKVEGPPEILEASNDGSVLYRLLVAPAHEFLKETLAKNDNVFIIPDGSLNSLNFETLVPQPKHYWIEDVTIVNSPSLRLLPRIQVRTGKLSGKLLLIGDPIAPDPGPDSAYPELPNAETQIQDIEKYFPGERRQVATRNQASPAAYLNSHPEQFSYIHFVAHGTASRLSPLDSAIILSREPASSAAEGQEDSFKLYARDIIGTHRLRAQLVTISACYSAGKRTYSGEGLVGLSWAFLRAGSHNVIAALWDVSDTSASQILDEFYGELKNGKSPGAALRAAKLSLLHKADFRSPFYWAAFQLYSGSAN
jgi:CHAT domain-containing protein/Flp pilus assembly protein TadD